METGMRSCLKNLNCDDYVLLLKQGVSVFVSKITSMEGARTLYGRNWSTSDQARGHFICPNNCI